MTESKYKLTYWNMRGRGEPIRMMFAYANVPFENVTVKREEWPPMKSSVPLGTVPYLEVDGVIIPTSVAIGRFLAKRFDLLGDGDVNQALVDALVDYHQDMCSLLVPVVREQDLERKKQLKEKVFTEEMPKKLEFLEAFQRRYNKDKDFLIGDRLTYADIFIANLMKLFQDFHPTVLDNFAYLKKHCDIVHNTKNIKEYVERRPKTEF